MLRIEGVRGSNPLSSTYGPMIMGPVAPSLRGQDHLTGLQWVLTGYLVTVAALLLLAGALADHFGRRWILIVGLCVMLVASFGLRRRSHDRDFDRGQAGPRCRWRARRAEQPRSAQRHAA